MKLSSLKTIVVALGLVAGVLSMTSCNKGYGCPADFSVDASLELPAPNVPTC